MKFTKKEYDRLQELRDELELDNNADSNDNLFKVGLGALALGGLSIPLALPVAIGLGVVGGASVMASFLDSKKDVEQLALTEELPLYSELIPKNEIFEHLKIQNVFGEIPTYSHSDMIEKSITYIYDIPFGLIDEDFEKDKIRIAKLLGADDVEISVEGTKVFIKHIKKAIFKDIYTYEPIMLPKTENFNVLIGMVDNDGEIEPYAFDFADEPHMLLAGVNGKGKSTILNCLILNLLINYTPKELDLYLIDFKGGVEFDCFENVRHVNDVIWEKDKFKLFLKHLEEKEVPRRLKEIKSVGAKNIFGYNKVSKKKMPFSLVVLDEFAQLSPTDDKDIIDQLIRLVGLTRASGIYFILATQRPSANIITNDIKTNLSNVVGLGVRDMHDTKCIFGDNDVELHKVKGKGKGYFRALGDYKYFQGFYLGVNPTDKSEQERTINQILKKYNLYR